MNWMATLPHKRFWWFFLAAIALLLEVVALYYQYGLDYLPCIVCIHIRLIVAAGLVLWVAAGIAIHSGWFNRVAQVGSVVLGGLFIERSWQLLATENGWVIGSCDMDLGMPAWLAVDRWIPWLFEIHEPCGVTPFVIARISMAEVCLLYTSPSPRDS